MHLTKTEKYSGLLIAGTTHSIMVRLNQQALEPITTTSVLGTHTATITTLLITLCTF